MATKIGILRNAIIKTATATMHINHGDIVINLFGSHVPNTVGNFIGLAEGTKEYKGQNTSGTGSDPFYDEVIFHRIIAGFMTQGGDLLGTGTGGPGYTFDDEIHPGFQFDRPYLLAMTNAGKRGGRGTNDSQFFITVVLTPYLNGARATSGEAVDDTSKKVVDEIARVATDHWDRPLEPVMITFIDIEK